MFFEGFMNMKVVTFFSAFITPIAISCTIISSVQADSLTIGDPLLPSFESTILSCGQALVDVEGESLFLLFDGTPVDTCPQKIVETKENCSKKTDNEDYEDWKKRVKREASNFTSDEKCPDTNGDCKLCSREGLQSATCKKKSDKPKNIVSDDVTYQAGPPEKLCAKAEFTCKYKCAD